MRTFLQWDLTEKGAEVYSTATDKDQAKIAFVKAKEMLKQSSHLLEYMDPWRMP